ncbi:outer membrane lipid asymmetry maintenance protein MlaD [Parendozoicomonas haliclonae]|uniref:Putative phospholipid ABC transporter-binding protein MlaD n=1 Tax=Parendozoicomonas haliclonae TaxID=1960125 RepID=A0A1X7AFE3_9GAMM|nr:outer membrane lipid asymmetry maintenance protein MlaD [Parendozoicomonas haliclonae]SMA37232.1 putative phospholipid ABC transporter-binding protein MlaD [Parendozoicomonas haliclonae]
MRMRTVEISVGAFLLAGLFALVLLALRVSGLSLNTEASTYRLYAEFDNVGSLTKRAKVAMGGVTIGRVVDVELDKKTYMARVVMDIDTNIDNIPVDSSAAIITAGLLGEKFIGISIGGAAEFLQDEETIDDTQSAIVLEDLIGKFLLGSVGSDDDSSGGDSF